MYFSAVIISIRYSVTLGMVGTKINDQQLFASAVLGLIGLTLDHDVNAISCMRRDS